MKMKEQKPNTTQLGTNNSDLLTRVSMITAMMGKKTESKWNIPSCPSDFLQTITIQIAQIRHYTDVDQ